MSDIRAFLVNDFKEGKEWVRRNMAVSFCFALCCSALAGFFFWLLIVHPPVCLHWNEWQNCDRWSWK